MEEILKTAGTRLGDINDIPEELKKRLRFFATCSDEDQIISVLKTYDGFANLDEVMVGLYRKYGIISDRANITSRLYRMSKRGVLEKVKGKKGVYKLKI